MKKINKLNLGFTDAENYKRRENKDLFNKIFIRNKYLDELCDPAVNFIVGEKGTGKTAYAVYLANSNYKQTIASIRYIRETEYRKFISLKKEKQLDLSDYTNIWKVIICLLMSQQIYNKEKCNFLQKHFWKFNALNDAVEEFYSGAFSPEIMNALSFIDESSLSATLLSKHLKAKGDTKKTYSFSETRFQTNLLFIQQKFEKALSEVKVSNNHIVFIDGIDIRPGTIPYEDYLDCVKGLTNAVWELNNDFFPTIKGQQGFRMRVVLLIRPDIFDSIGLQNQNTKIRDNSVLLDWRTEYINYKHSDMFLMIDHLLESQQTEALERGESWYRYFPYDSPSVANLKNDENPTSFISFLRYSYYRPRDIITMISILKENYLEKKSNALFFQLDDFENASFQRKYSNYLLGEIKDHLSFYYKPEEYELFLSFFSYLNGKFKFNYTEYCEAYKAFITERTSTDIKMPQFMNSEMKFLQFLYDLNILCYIESPEGEHSHPFYHWCFKDRNYSNISPKVKTHVKYQIFFGLQKALNIGKTFKKRKMKKR